MPPDSPVLPYGSWPSPISAADVARAARRLSFPRFIDTGSAATAGSSGSDVGEVWWGEGRPEEKGREAVVRRRPDGTVADVLAAPWSARTRYQEYGGKCWLPVPAPAGPGGPALVFTSYADQRVYRLDPGANEPVALTPPPPFPAAMRYAEPVVVGAQVWWLRERHLDQTGRNVRRDLVAVPLDGAAGDDEHAVRVVLDARSDFLASPALSPDGSRLAWLAWDHPRMPWDGTELRVAPLGPDGMAGAHRLVLGGATESVQQPEWVDATTLYAVSDRSGWWNLYRLRVDRAESPSPQPPGQLQPPEPLCARDEEFGVPLWVPGPRTYARLHDGRIAVLHGRGGTALGVLDPRTGDLHDLDLPFATWSGHGSLHGDGRRVVGVAAAPDRPDAVLAVDCASGASVVVAQALPQRPDPAYLPVPRAVTLPGGPANGGREVHAYVYPPTSPVAVGPPESPPPYLVHCHGGPTAHSVPRLSLEFAYFTSRGIGVIDVNYGGSSGYGRAYRERLREQWGVVDVEDCVAAALALADLGEADRSRLAIRGGSAGGWTTLAALTGTDVFAAGVSYYGISELLRFAADTHDFESRYLDGLLGPLPDAHERYVSRAPLSHVDDVSCPVLLLQGLDDEVVPPSQSELFRDALARKGIPHAYLAFPGEAHGFRRAETEIAALEAELSFYGQVLGFDPPGVPRLALSPATARSSSAQSSSA